MKIAIITLAAAILFAAAPAVLAQNASSKTPDRHHHVSKKHPRLVSGYAPSHTMRAKGLKTGYPGAFDYAPSEPKDWALEGSRQAGGGGGGGSGM